MWRRIIHWVAAGVKDCLYSAASSQVATSVAAASVSVVISVVDVIKTSSTRSTQRGTKTSKRGSLRVKRMLSLTNQPQRKPNLRHSQCPLPLHMTLLILARKRMWSLSNPVAEAPFPCHHRLWAMVMLLQNLSRPSRVQMKKRRRWLHPTLRRLNCM